MGKDIKIFDIIKRALISIAAILAGLFVIEQIQKIGKVENKINWIPTNNKKIVKINKKKKYKLPIDKETGHQYTSDEITAIGLPDENEMLELIAEVKHEPTNRKMRTNISDNNPTLDL
jgi:hypothetical protein